MVWTERPSEVILHSLNRARNITKQCNELLGIISGLMADNDLNEKEVQFLQMWLFQNEEVRIGFPGALIYDTVEDILSDGVVTENELEAIKKLLKDVLGGTLEDTGTVGQMASTLPCNDDCDVIFEGMRYCFTGEFMFGTRRECEEAIVERGGTTARDLSTKTRYLVIGTFISPHWAQTTHGRKITSALALRGAGHNIRIISEERWQKALSS